MAFTPNKPERPQDLVCYCDPDKDQAITIFYDSADGLFYRDKGQWKEITDTTWATIPSTISTTLGATIEFTSFILDKPLVAIRNLTQGTTYSVSNALNSIKVYTILVDSINLFNGDLLEFEFTNPDNPSCPFINQSTITF